MKEPIIYVVGAHAESVAVIADDFIEAFKERLRQRFNAIILQWVSGDTWMPDMYRRDIENINMCDVMIAIINEPSTTTGMEIEEAIHKQKPLLCLVHKDCPIPHLLVDAAESGRITMHTYHDLYGAVGIAEDFLRQEVAVA